MPNYDKYSAIAGDSVYCDGVLVARDINITLPEMSAVSVELNANGPFDMPVTAQYESMEATITKIGVAYDIARLVEPKRHTVEIRAAQDILLTSGEKVTRQVKAFLGCIPKTIPEISLEFGSIAENEITLTVLRYQLYENNKELWLFDRLNDIYRVNGTNYAQSINSLL